MPPRKNRGSKQLPKENLTELDKNFLLLNQVISTKFPKHESIFEEFFIGIATKSVEEIKDIYNKISPLIEQNFKIGKNDCHFDCTPIVFNIYMTSENDEERLRRIAVLEFFVAKKKNCENNLNLMFRVACGSGNKGNTKLLMEKFDIDIHQVDDKGNNCFDYAIRSGDLDTIEWLWFHDKSVCQTSLAQKYYEIAYEYVTKKGQQFGSYERKIFMYLENTCKLVQRCR